MHLEFIGRSPCHLCDEATPIVARVARWLRLPVEEVDVEADPDLLIEFGLRIPVVRLSTGDVLAEGAIGFGKLLIRALLARIASIPQKKNP